MKRSRGLWFTPLTLLTALSLFAAMSSLADASVLAYWRFEEGTGGNAASGAGSILDSEGGFDGDPAGGPFYRSDVAISPVPQNEVSNALSLELINGDYVSFADPSSALNPTNAFTVEFWMKADTQVATPQDREVVIDHSHGFGDDTGWAMQTNNAGKMRFAVGTDPGFSEAVSSINVRDGSWYHIAGTFDASDSGQELKLYVNGVLNATATSSGSLAAGNSRAVQIGRSWSSSFPRFYTGFIDEVRISDSVLSPSEFLSVPEPSSLALAALGLLGAAYSRRKML